MKFYNVTYVPESGMVQQVIVAAGGIQEARRRLIAAGVPVTKANSVVYPVHRPKSGPVTRERVAAIRAAMDFSKLKLTEASMFEAMLSKYEGKEEEAVDDGEE